MPMFGGGGSGTVSSIATGTGLTGGPVTSTGTISLANIANHDVLANTSGSSAAPVATTLSALIDDAIGNTRGSILERGVSGWTVITPGSSGTFLQSAGASADPVWASGNAGTVTSVSGTGGLTGTVTSSGSLSLASIANHDLLANTSGSTAAPVATTLTALIDDAIGSTRGAILERGASGWALITPGTSGFALVSGGAGADPSYVAVAQLATANVFTKNQAVTSSALTDGTTISVDASLSNNFKVTLGGNRTLANPTNLSDVMILNFRIAQDGTGTRTLAYGSKFKWPGGTAFVLSTAANAVDLISCYYDGTSDTLMCSGQKAYS